MPKIALTLISAGDQLQTFLGRRFVIVNSGLSLIIHDNMRYQMVKEQIIHCSLEVFTD